MLNEFFYQQNRPKISPKLAAIEKRKKLNKTYLKGRYGKRFYYDYGKRYIDDDKIDYELDDEQEIKDPNRQLKCVFTKDLRRQKLFAYLKYLNGRKILVRDLAWKFAVTERTIQTDLKYLIDNGFVERKLNKTREGKQTKNSYIVNKAKEKDLHLPDSYLFVVIVAKKDGEYYILTKTEYNENSTKTIKHYVFDLPYLKQENTETIDDRANQYACYIFRRNMIRFYKGMVYSSAPRGKDKSKDKFGFIIKEYWREKFYFTLFELDEILPARAGYFWIKLSVAPRRIGVNSIDRGINYIKRNILG